MIKLKGDVYIFENIKVECGLILDIYLYNIYRDIFKIDYESHIFLINVFARGSRRSVEAS